MKHLRGGFVWSTTTRWGVSLVLALATLGSWQGLLRVERAPVHRQRGGEMGLVRMAEPNRPWEQNRPAAARRVKPSPPTEKAVPPPLMAKSHPTGQPAATREALPRPSPIDRALAARPQPVPRDPPPPAPETHRNRSPAPGDADGVQQDKHWPAQEVGGVETPVELKALDRGFRLVTPVMPVYPSQAKRLGKEGEVRLELGIDPAGKVHQVTIVEEPVGWGFGEATRTAYRIARFTPPTMRGTPVWVVWRKTLRFTP